MKTVYQVIYRTGGWMNFEWHPVLRWHDDWKSAIDDALDVARGGYKTRIVKRDASDDLDTRLSYPMPTTLEGK